jgi:hypothetical protein
MSFVHSLPVLGTKLPSLVTRVAEIARVADVRWAWG